MNRIWVGVCFLGILGACGRADMGAMDGGGGDTYVAEFKAIASTVLASVRMQTGSFTEFELNALEKAVSSSQVSFKNSLLLDGKDVEAINYPSSGRIEVSFSRWGAAHSREARAKLVFHEHLGLMGVDDSAYQISNRLVLVDSEDDCNPVKGCPQYRLACRAQFHSPGWEPSVLFGGSYRHPGAFGSAGNLDFGSGSLAGSLEGSFSGTPSRTKLVVAVNGRKLLQGEYSLRQSLTETWKHDPLGQPVFGYNHGAKVTFESVTISCAARSL